MAFVAARRRLRIKWARGQAWKLQLPQHGVIWSHLLWLLFLPPLASSTMFAAAVKQQQQQRKLLPRSFSTSFPYCNSFTTQSPPRVQVVVLKTVLRDHTAIPRNPIFLTSLAICSTSSAQPFENPHMICKSWNFQHLLLKSLRLVSSKKFHLFHFHKNKIENFS